MLGPDPNFRIQFNLNTFTRFDLHPSCFILLVRAGGPVCHPLVPECPPRVPLASLFQSYYNTHVHGLMKLACPFQHPGKGQEQVNRPTTRTDTALLLLNLKVKSPR